MAQYTFDLGGKGHIYTVEADSQDEGFALAIDRDHQKYRGPQAQGREMLVTEPTDFLSRVSQTIKAPGTSLPSPRGQMARGLTGKPTTTEAVNPYTKTLPADLPAGVRNLPFDIGDSLNAMYRMIPRTLGETAGLAASMAIGGSAGALTNALPAKRALTRQAVAALLGGEGGYQAQMRVPQLFGEEKQPDNILSHLVSLIAPYATERGLARPAAKSPTQMSREIMKDVDLPENVVRNVEMTPALAPEKTIQDLYNRLKGVAGPSTQEEALLSRAGKLKVKEAKLTERKAGQTVAEESAAGKLAFRKEKLKDIRTTEQATRKETIVDLQGKLRTSLPGEKAVIKSQIDDLKKEGIRAARTPEATAEVRGILDELKTLRVAKRIAGQNVNIIDQALAKNNVAQVKQAELIRKVQANPSVDPAIKEVFAKSVDPKSKLPSAEGLTKAMAELPNEQWEKFQQFMTPDEMDSARRAFGEYFTKTSYDPKTKFLSRAQETLGNLGWDKVQRFYPGKVAEIAQLAHDIDKISSITEELPNALSMSMSSSGNKVFWMIRMANWGLLADSTKFIDDVIANPRLGQEFHILATKAANPAVLTTLPILRQWLADNAVEVENPDKRRF